MSLEDTTGYLHPIYEQKSDRDGEVNIHNTTSTVETDTRNIFVFHGGDASKSAGEMSLRNFISLLPKNWNVVWRDIQKNTPQLMLVGVFIGSLALSIIISHTFKYLYIEYR